MSHASPKMPVSPKSLLPSETELKRGPAMKKQSRLHNYVPVTLVLTACSLQYYHNNHVNKPACVIPLSAVISVGIVSDPSISVYHGISVDSSFTVFIGDRSFKFRVDNAITAKLWMDTILHAKEKQSADAGINNPLFITNTDGDNTDGTRFWRSQPVGYVETFSAAIGSISAALPAAVARSKSVKERDSSGLSRKQVEALLTFERVICLSESISKYTAEAFFDCSIALSRARPNCKSTRDDCNNTSHLLGNSIVHWLCLADQCHSPTVIETRAESLSPSPTIRSSASSPSFPSHCPPRSVILRQWIESCVMREFRRFSSPEITTQGTLKHTKIPFRSGSIMGQFTTSMVRSAVMKPDCDLLFNWLNPALMMVANISEPVTVYNEASSPSSCSQLSPGAMPRRGGKDRGTAQSQSEDSCDLGSFFKDVVACHQHRQIVAFEADPSDADPDELDDIENDSYVGVLFPLKYKPGWTYFAENAPSALNMRSHIFVEEGREDNDDVFINMKRNRVVRNARCKSERFDSMRTHFDTAAESQALRASFRTQSFDGTELDRIFSGKPSPQSRPGADDRGEKCQCRSKAHCSCATHRKKGRETDSRAPVNPIEHEVELENEICTLIIQTMAECRGDVPEPLEMLFSSIRDICKARNLSGVDSRATGRNVYYSCCSTLLINQLLTPALLAPVKWNIAVPAFLNRRGHNHIDRGSRDLNFSEKISVIESSIKVTFGEISPLRVTGRNAPDSHKKGTDKRRYSQDDAKGFKHIEGQHTPTMAARISKMLSNNGGFDSLNSSLHKTRSGTTTSSTPSQSTDQHGSPTRNRALSLNLSPERLSRCGSVSHMDNDQDAPSSWRSSKAPSDGAPKKLVLSDNLMHAAISLLSIAHILAGEGEGKTEDAMLFVWGGARDQGREVFQAAKALIANVPMQKAYELSERLRKISTYSAPDSVHVCSSSRSGFTSAGECRALSGLARAITRVAGQSNINIAPHGSMKPAKNTGDEKARMLMEPLCHYYEDIGGGEIEQSND